MIEDSEDDDGEDNEDEENGDEKDRGLKGAPKEIVPLDVSHI